MKKTDRAETNCWLVKMFNDGLMLADWRNSNFSNKESRFEEKTLKAK